MMCTLWAWAGDDNQEHWSAWNKYLHNYKYYVHVGYNIGGTAPIGMPASIRTLHSYTLQPNFTLGVDAHHVISGKWGFLGGLHFENKGMRTDAGEGLPHEDCAWWRTVGRCIHRKCGD